VERAADVTISYDATIEQLEALYHGPLVPARQAGLRRMYALLKLLDNPHRRIRSVHVVGSTGKGSTTAMIASILGAAGLRTGAFRSPHLERYSERIEVLGAEVARDAWSRSFEVVWPYVERLARSDSPDYALGRPSLFEVLFAMACVVWREADVEWAVVEAGLGGRLDPTNVLSPDVVAITNISLEHTQILGNTIAAIAREKAAVIKPGCDVVTTAGDDEAVEVIAHRAALVRAPVSYGARDCWARSLTNELQRLTMLLCDREVELTVSLPVGGDFQLANAVCAFAVARALQRRGVPIGNEAIVEGLRTVSIRGRFSVVDTQPLVIADGAHAPHAAGMLQMALQHVLGDRPVHFVFAALADKDVDMMARALAPSVSHVFVTTAPNTERAAPLAEVASAFERLELAVTIVPDPHDALKAARGAAGPEGVVVITGSMYLVGELGRARVLGGSQ
jgi:dihydrofolate synthase/folylpolyglutamate synthase